MSFHLILADERRQVKRHCCHEMSEQANLFSADEQRPLQGTTDRRIYWSPVFDEYGLICQPSAEILRIQYCPFCGVHLPASRRDAWFERLDASGWKTWGDPVPCELLGHDWVDRTTL